MKELFILKFLSYKNCVLGNLVAAQLWFRKFSKECFSNFRKIEDISICIFFSVLLDNKHFHSRSAGKLGILRKKPGRKRGRKQLNILLMKVCAGYVR